jgi:CRP-like cAMP-binding protein
MVLDWFNETRGSGDSVADLIARRKYARAIETLRAQFEGRSPDAKTRLQLADLLVLAGRVDEAIPILVSLADEFTVDGFVAKAVAILKRIEKLDPGRGDVEERLASLVNRSFKAAPPVRFAPPRRLEIGIEVEAEPLPAEPEPTVTIPEGAEAQGPEAHAELEPEPTPAPEGSAPAAEPDTPTAIAAAEPPEDGPRPAVARRIRSILGRLLAARHAEEEPAPGEPESPELTLPEGAAPEQPAPVAAPPPDAATPSPPAEPPGEAPPPAPQVAEPQDAKPLDDVPAGPLEMVAEPETPESMTHRIKGFFGRLWPGRGEDEEGASPEAPPAEAGGTEASQPEEFDLSPASAEPRPEAVTEAEPAPAAEDPPMSEEVFHERLLDVIEDVLRDGARRGPRPRAPIDGRTLSESPLLGELSEEERLKVVRGLRLLTYEPGDVILTEGEPGETLYLLTTGTVKVFVRNPASRNIEVRVLREGDFFGEVSILSGRPRTATITAASQCELLELDRPTLDALGHDHPGIVDTLEAYYIQRTQSADNAAVRAAAVADGETQRRAAEVLRAHFGDRVWDPKMRLKLADVLLKANKQQEALPILVDLADAMARQGHPEKAIAILKKIERIEGRHTEEINLAPLERRAPPPPTPPAPGPGARRRPREMTSEFFEGWMVDLVKDTVKSALPSAYRLPSRLGSSAGLLLSPLFEDFSDEEIQALIDGLRLLVFEPGDIVLTEGEPGNSVLVVTSGAVKVFVRSPSGHNAEVCELGEGEFFGEISTLSGRPRSATVTAAARTEVLELDKLTLDAICAAHPRVRAVLEDVYIQRAAHPYAARVRGVQQPAS